MLFALSVIEAELRAWWIELSLKLFDNINSTVPTRNDGHKANNLI